MPRFRAEVILVGFAPPSVLTTLLLASLGVAASGERVTPVKLPAGFASWTLTYRHDKGPARLAFDWEGPGFPREPLPARLLFHDPKSEPPPDRFEEGRRLADRLGCANCH